MGDVGVGVAVPAARLHVLHANPTGGAPPWPIRFENAAVPGFVGGLRISSDGFLDMTNRATVGGAAFARLSSTGVWTSVSDERLKENISPAGDLLAAALRLEPIAYTLSGLPEQPQIGFSAQQAGATVPGVVCADEPGQGGLLTLDYARLSVVAIGAIRQQQAIIEQQRAAIDDLGRRNAALESRLRALESKLAGPTTP